MNLKIGETVRVKDEFCTSPEDVLYDWVLMSEEDQKGLVTIRSIQDQYSKPAQIQNVFSYMVEKV